MVAVAHAMALLLAMKTSCGAPVGVCSNSEVSTAFVGDALLQGTVRNEGPINAGLQRKGADCRHCATTEAIEENSADVQPTKNRIRETLKDAVLACTLTGVAVSLSRARKQWRLRAAATPTTR
eukprot:CAMPEP_0172689828 /NCGR_PEP_ID=MMETSP1074-20121228/23427_1 /TAXON_ID=2916 /ORGANISM="Ceratium fusus, Strain PA161109" /LENGTH=122 /DNA_ID=CAMNT_0013509693 /DNA_START=18 /DNA_END=386 /DNA_ORIENTATION=-